MSNHGMSNVEVTTETSATSVTKATAITASTVCTVSTVVTASDVLITGFDIPAKRYRKGKAKVYNYNKNRLNRFYEQKRIEVIYTIENDKIVTITVYVFYGRWKEHK